MVSVTPVNVGLVSTVSNGLMPAVGIVKSVYFATDVNSCTNVSIPIHMSLVSKAGQNGDVTPAASRVVPLLLLRNLLVHLAEEVAPRRMPSPDRVGRGPDAGGAAPLHQTGPDWRATTVTGKLCAVGWCPGFRCVERKTTPKVHIVLLHTRRFGRNCTKVNWTHQVWTFRLPVGVGILNGPPLQKWKGYQFDVGT